MYDDEESLTHIEQTPDKVLADRLRQEKAFANFKFSKKHIAFLKELMKIEIQDHLEDKLARSGERIGIIEDKVREIQAAQKLKDLDQDHQLRELKRDIADKVSSAKTFVAGIAFMVTIIMGLISKFG